MMRRQRRDMDGRSSLGFVLLAALAGTGSGEGGRAGEGRGVLWNFNTVKQFVIKT